MGRRTRAPVTPGNAVAARIAADVSRNSRLVVTIRSLASMTTPRYCLIALAVCAGSLAAQTTVPAALNQLTDAERAAGWRLLFDGKTLKGWRGLGYDTVPKIGRASCRERV